MKREIKISKMLQAELAPTVNRMDVLSELYQKEAYLLKEKLRDSKEGNMYELLFTHDLFSYDPIKGVVTIEMGEKDEA